MQVWAVLTQVLCLATCDLVAGNESLYDLHSLSGHIAVTLPQTEESHVVTADTVKPDPHKVEVLRAWPSADIQQSTNNIRSVLSSAGYFRRFIPKFPTLAGPLLERVSSKEKLPWTVQCEKSFHDIKNALINATALHHPDLSKPFHVYSDASDYAFGAVLTQKHEDELKPVAWAGRKMSIAEANYYTRNLEKEVAAITSATRQWRCYLENNQPVYIHSDNFHYAFYRPKRNSQASKPDGSSLCHESIGISHTSQEIRMW